MRGERMTQHVGAQALGKARLPRVTLENLPEADARQPGPAALDVHEQAGARPLPQQRWPSLPQVPLDPVPRLVANRNNALLVALAGTREIRRFQIDVGRPQ